MDEQIISVSNFISSSLVLQAYANIVLFGVNIWGLMMWTGGTREYRINIGGNYGKQILEKHIHIHIKFVTNPMTPTNACFFNCVLNRRHLLCTMNAGLPTKYHWLLRPNWQYLAITNAKYIKRWRNIQSSDQLDGVGTELTDLPHAKKTPLQNVPL